MINNFHLLSHTLFVYRLKYLFDELGIHAAQCALRAALLEDFVVASGLQDGHVMFLFVSADFSCHTHSLGQLLDKIVVTFVNLLTQFAEVLGALRFLADDEQVEDVVQHIRSDLLGGVAPGTVGVAVALYNQSVEAQVHSLLAERGNEFALSTYVAGVAEDGQVGDAAA